jgi:hypothetical protein
MVWLLMDQHDDTAAVGKFEADVVALDDADGTHAQMQLVQRHTGCAAHFRKSSFSCMPSMSAPDYPDSVWTYSVLGCCGCASNLQV